MRGKVAKDLRKQAFQLGYHRDTTYTDNENGVIFCEGEKREYRKLKSVYKFLKSKGK